MDILFLCKRYYTNKDLIQDSFGRLYHLPVQLGKFGHEVDVLAIDYRNSDKLEITKKGVRFNTIPASLFSLPLLLFRLHHFVKKHSPEVIIASGDSHIGYLALVLAKHLKSRFVFDVYDYYPSFKGNRIPGMKYMFQTAVHGAEFITIASRALAIKLGRLAKETLIVENGVDGEVFFPMDIQVARHTLQIQPSERIIGYFGSISPDRGLLLIKACEIVRDDFPDLRLRLAGRVDNIELNAPWITYLGELRQENIPIQIAVCDVVALPYAETVFNSNTGSCKIAEYLACGKPVVATRVADHADIFEMAPIGLCNPDPESMATAIKGQLLRPQVVPFPAVLEWQSVAARLHCRLQ